jgi:hypothetical protein
MSEMLEGGPPSPSVIGVNSPSADARVNLELYAKPVTLAPGERQRLQHRIEVEAR